MEKKLISVVGPTAIGKTKLAIALANHFSTEIVSADSRQFFKELYIGTAVPNDTELAHAIHHFIQHKSIFEKYSVGEFEKDALKKIAEIHSDNNNAILVGGSGLYVDAVIKGLDNFPKVDSEIRVRLNAILKEKGIVRLQQMLKKQDSIYYEKVDLDNPHRVIRALEICLGSGQPYSSFLKKEYHSRPFQTITVGITAERELIYERINKRVDSMIANGLVAEVESLYKNRLLNALQTVGYKELFNYLDGQWTLDFAIAEIKKNTRRFAKRQLTWFRKNENTLWMAHDAPLATVIEKIKEQMTTLS